MFGLDVNARRKLVCIRTVMTAGMRIELRIPIAYHHIAKVRKRSQQSAHDKRTKQQQRSYSATEMHQQDLRSKHQCRATRLQPNLFRLRPQGSSPLTPRPPHHTRA